MQSCVQALKHRLEALEASELPSELPSEFLEDKLQSAQVVTPEEKECSESQGNLLNDSLDDRRSPDPAPGDLEAPGLEEAKSLSADAEGDTADELVRESPSKLPSELTASELAKRLGVNKSWVSRHKQDISFEGDTREKDPEAIAWRYDRKKQKFFPANHAN